MNVVLGVVLGMAISMSLTAGWVLSLRRGRVLAPEAAAMQAAVHAATSLLPPLREDFNAETARPVARALRTLTGAQAIALAGRDGLLAFDGIGADHHAPGDLLETLAPPARGDRVRVEARLACAAPGCPLRSA